MSRKRKILMIAAIVATAAAAYAQVPGDRLVVPLSDPSRPAVVKVHLINGSITVKAYNGKEVVVQARARQGESHEESREGMRRIPITATGAEAEEEGNVVTVRTSAIMRTVDLEIQTPVRSALKLKTINNGRITVEGVQGEIEAEDINGSVTLTNVSGSVVAHALNGAVVVKFNQVDPQKAMAFSSFNGNIDVTFPADLKANVKLKSDRGEVYSDFELTVKPSPQPALESGRDSKGTYRVRLDKTVYGTINGGGQELQFSTLNGSIYIRKAGK